MGELLCILNKDLDHDKKNFIFIFLKNLVNDFPWIKTILFNFKNFIFLFNKLRFTLLKLSEVNIYIYFLFKIIFFNLKYFLCYYIFLSSYIFLILNFLILMQLIIDFH